MLRRVQPVLLEGALHPGHERTLDAGVGIAPVIGRIRVAAPLIGETDSAGKPDPAIDDQVAPMAPAIRAIKPERLCGMVIDELATLAFEEIDILVIELRAGADAVENDADLDAGLGALREGALELPANRIGVEDVRLKVDALGGAANRGEDGGEDFIPVLQQLD